jgi:hypothetical protein
MADDELLQVNSEKIIPEAQDILASEFLSRGWDQQKIDARRSELERRKQQPVGVSERPVGGSPTIWGILVVLIVIIATSVGSWPVMIICAVIGGLCIVLGKKSRERKQQQRQVERDRVAGEILDKLGVSKPGGHKDVS